MGAAEQWNDTPVLDAKSAEMKFPRSIRSKFAFSIITFSIFFLWGMIYTDDPGWILLGICTVIFLALYYKLRILRRVRVDAEGITQWANARVWRWEWKEIDSIVERFNHVEGIPENSLRRITFIHDSGRDISVDSRMIGFRPGIKIIYRSVKEHGLNIQHKDTPVVGFFYW